jgi:hypothetical protein
LWAFVELAAGRPALEFQQAITARQRGWIAVSLAPQMATRCAAAVLALCCLLFDGHSRLVQRVRLDR